MFAISFCFSLCGQPVFIFSYHLFSENDSWEVHLGVFIEKILKHGAREVNNVLVHRCMEGTKRGQELSLVGLRTSLRTTRSFILSISLQESFVWKAAIRSSSVKTEHTHSLSSRGHLSLNFAFASWMKGYDRNVVAFCFTLLTWLNWYLIGPGKCGSFSGE